MVAVGVVLVVMGVVAVTTFAVVVVGAVISAFSVVSAMFVISHFFKVLGSDPKSRKRDRIQDLVKLKSKNKLCPQHSISCQICQVSKFSI